MKTSVFLVLAYLSVMALGGRIYPWGEPFITYPNKGLLTSMDIYFSLDNPLPTGNVIRISFPFST